MKREIKFRAWNVEAQKMVDLAAITPLALDAGMNTQLAMQGASGLFIPFIPGMEIMQFTGLKDKNGVEIYFGDILRFADKREWYRIQYAGELLFAKSKEEHAAVLTKMDEEPYELREVKDIKDYEWLLSSEIQTYWEVCGNIHQQPELLQPTGG